MRGPCAWVSVVRMGEAQLKAFFAFKSGGIAALEHVYDAGYSADALTGLGAADDYAETLCQLASKFFAPTTHSRYQQRARDAARRNSHCVETLDMIVRTGRAIADPTDRWDYTEQLCATRGDTATLTKRAATLRKKFLAPRVPKDGATIRRSTAHDKISVTFTASSNAMQDVITTLETRDEHGATIDAIDWLVNNRSLSQAPAAVHLIVTDDQIDHILAGTDDQPDTEPVVVTNTGIRMTTSQVLDRHILPDGYITLASGHLGPINTHRMRLASPVQRLALEADSPTCCWPDCNTPISGCQAHHLTEYIQGGETTPANMCWLCPHHNAVNGQPGRGRMTRIDGRIAWVGPNNSPPKFTGRSYTPHRAPVGGPAQGRPPD